MASFKVTVERTDEYDIEIDEAIVNKEWLEKWSRVFHTVTEPADVAGILAQRITREGTGNFYEGFAHVKTHMPNGHIIGQWKGNKMLEDADYESGIVVHIKSHDEDYDITVSDNQS